MKSNPFKNRIVSMLVISILLLLSSQTLLAVKPIKEPPPPPDPVVVIDSVVVDYTENEIVVMGIGFVAEAEVFLGGVNVSDDTTLIDNNLVITFTPIMTDSNAVPTPGNYSLVLDGNVFSVYFNSAVIDPSIVLDCPCITDWEPHKTLQASCNYESLDGSQVASELIDGELLWVFASEFDSDAGTGKCALVLDGIPRTLDSEPQHVACSSYIKSTFTNPLATSCLITPTDITGFYTSTFPIPDSY